MPRLDAKLLEAEIKRILTIFERSVKILMECRLHQRYPADSCTYCNGMTKFGPIEEVWRFLKEKNVLDIEVMNNAPKKKKGMVESLAYGAGYISGATSWIGGKLVHQVVRKKDVDDTSHA